MSAAVNTVRRMPGAPPSLTPSPRLKPYAYPPVRSGRTADRRAPIGREDGVSQTEPIAGLGHRPGLARLGNRGGEPDAEAVHQRDEPGVKRMQNR